MNVEHRTLNVQHPIMYSVDYKKGCAKQNHPLRFCESVVLDSIKRSANNIRRSMLDVRCSTFKAYSPPGGFAVPASQSFIREVQGPHQILHYFKFLTRFQLLTRQLNSSFRPQRSGEPESRKSLAITNFRIRENDGLVAIKWPNYLQR